MRVPLVMRTIAAGAAIFMCARAASAGAPGNPGSGTSGPAVPLGADQQRAIAAKGVPAVTATPTFAAPTRLVDGKRIPVPSMRSQAGAAAAPASQLRPQLKLPTISPAIGRIPRPGWSHPYELSKRPDVAVVGDRRVTVAPSGGTAAPARGTSPATEPRP
jgi:hypothetical protein